ncbi:DUF6503 family protein [Tunicatimonas pelagia]|uniref:DUF6503 family protein n=1 Tax=Tunicatimonas pelagia TaxID=931531 RepID=UPI002666BF52|nr:DUF6503 family protein [Tunicatimonas pelagia]WKN41744.1 hypothetical protein P0M28_22155 [Tunicatimonas pelagia]
MKLPLLLFTVIILILTNCATPSPPAETESAALDSLARVPSSWIDERVAKAQQRLNSSNAGTFVWQAIEAHGGLTQWFSNGPLAFQFNYQPLDGSTPRNTYEVADYWSARTRHQRIDTTGEYGWTGTQAWIHPADTEMPYNTRFWSLTPYYFVGIPFVLADEGTNFELLGEQTYQDRVYDAVKITFGENVGDAPDDYYVVYIDRETKRVDVTRYIVSYPGYFPDGGHLPEKFMAWIGHQTVDGITLATGFDTYWWKGEQPAEHITKIAVSRVEFTPDITNTYFEAPEDARLISEM